MFEAEKKGLEEIRRSRTCPVPHPVMVGTYDGISYLFQPFIKRKEPDENSWAQFGRDLAEMHAVGKDHFGFKSDNFLGSLTQTNSKHSNWHDFLIEQRLGAQFELAAKNGFMDRNDHRNFNQLCGKINEWIPVEQPSLLHGDLWIGNCIPSGQGCFFVIDPAVYWGHREMDLAMSELFGGFHSTFYSAYQEQFPLVSGYDDRKELYQLYFLLAHMNLFGHAYVQSVRSIIKKFQ